TGTRISGAEIGQYRRAAAAMSNRFTSARGKGSPIRVGAHADGGATGAVDTESACCDESASDAPVVGAASRGLSSVVVSGDCGSGNDSAGTSGAARVGAAGGAAAGWACRSGRVTAARTGAYAIARAVDCGEAGVGSSNGRGTAASASDPETRAVIIPSAIHMPGQQRSVGGCIRPSRHACPHWHHAQRAHHNNARDGKRLGMSTVTA